MFPYLAFHPTSIINQHHLSRLTKPGRSFPKKPGILAKGCSVMTWWEGPGEARRKPQGPFEKAHSLRQIALYTWRSALRWLLTALACIKVKMKAQDQAWGIRKAQPGPDLPPRR